MELNNTSFALTITETFKQLAADPVLKKHQQITSSWVKEGHSVLVQHDLGEGKSLIAAAVLADSIADKYDVIFLSAKTLHGNMQGTIKKYLDLRGQDESILHDKGEPKYKFVTMNASNMLEQVYRATTNNTLDNKLKSVSQINLNNKCLIIDEAHNLFNSITNGSQNALGLYHAILRGENTKVVFLSGTPIVNHPFELVPCYNMIARKEVLPTAYEDFIRFFVDMKAKKVKNRAKFQNRIVGLTSYYGKYYTKDSFDLNKVITKKDFPDKLPPEIKKIPMSIYQYSQYVIARDVELQEASFGSTSGQALQKPQGIFTSSYRRLSRQTSNIAFPSQAISIDGRKITLSSEKVESGDLEQLDKYSPKFKQMIENLNKEKGKSLVYSSFVENAGINMFAKALTLNGWKELNIKGGCATCGKNKMYYQKNDLGYEYVDSDDDEVEYSTSHTGGSAKKTFVRITGDVMPEDRYPLIDKFNNEKNKTGDEVKLILISGAGAEGLDLKAIRTIHIMEPYWNWMRLNQVIGRGVRYKSHDQLPKKDQNVKTIIYTSTYPKTVDKKDKLYNSEKTTDVTLLDDSLQLHEIINEFYIAMAEAAIDCATHNNNPKLHCRLCTPTGEPLYLDDIYKDMSVRSPCKPLEKESVEAKEITVDDKKLAYYKDGKDIQILEYVEDIAGYTELPRNSKYYPIIYDKIKK